MEKELLKASDVAPLLGVTTGRVYQLIAAGAIPATRVAGAIRIPRAAWATWLAERSEQALAGGTTGACSTDSGPERSATPRARRGTSGRASAKAGGEL